MTEPDWAVSDARSTPRIFDWDVTEPPCRWPCTDWRHAHPAPDLSKPSSRHLEVAEDE